MGTQVLYETVIGRMGVDRVTGGYDSIESQYSLPAMVSAGVKASTFCCRLNDGWTKSGLILFVCQKGLEDSCRTCYMYWDLDGIVHYTRLADFHGTCNMTEQNATF